MVNFFRWASQFTCILAYSHNHRTGFAGRAQYLRMSVSRPLDVPNAPGVYEFTDLAGRVLYVGKAKDLGRRVASYFAVGAAQRTARLVLQASDLRWVVCASEAEALVLEREWIHAKQPAFNIRLRAGTGYGGIHVSADAVARLGVWRGRRPRTGTSLGPYPGTSARDLVDSLQLVFGVRTCDESTYRKAAQSQRPCLLGETGKCLAPCIGRVSVAEHNEAALALINHIRRPDPCINDRIEAEMRSLAADENFEAASRRRDQIKALDVLEQRQRVLGPGGWDRVAVSLWRDGDRMALALTHVNDGAVSQVDTYISVDDPMLSDDEAMSLVLPSLDLGGIQPLTSQLTAMSRKARGDRERGLLAFTQAQARSACERELTATRDDPSVSAEALARLSLLLGVSGPLRRIECMDVSHTQGRHTVGSVVVFYDGVARREEFRVAHLQDVDGDDYAAMRELVTLRTSGRRLGLTQLPDLLLIDGGPGQVAAAFEALNANGLLPSNHDSGVVSGSANVARTPQSVHGLETGPALAGLAKRFEELWPVAATRPVLLGAHDPVLHLLTSVRDHAHRHALDANRRRRERDALRTGLDSIPGVGAARRRALLSRFGTLDAVARAPVEELEGVTGVGRQLAQRIALHFSGLSEGSTHLPEPK